MRLKRHVAVVGVALVGLASTLLVACGGNAAVSQPGASPAGASPPASSGASALAASTPATAPGAAATSVPAPPAGGAASTVACSLTTAADVSATYGEPFDAGQPSSPGGYSACLFKQSGGGIDTVTLTVMTGSQADTGYAANRTAYDATDVSGLGDKAFVSTDGGMIGVERGSLTILVHLVGFEKETPASLQSKEKAFAQIVLNHAAS